MPGDPYSAGIGAGMGMLGMGTSIIGGLISKGKKPIVPDFIPLDIETITRDANKANIANFGDVSKLGGMANEFNQEQILKMLRVAIPGYDDIQKQQSKVIGEQLRGEIPSDVANQVSRRASERNLFRGATGQFGRNVEARDLGLTSLDITNKALDSATRWLQSTKSLAVPQLADYSTMFVNPTTALNIRNQENQFRFQRNWLENQIGAMPAPTNQVIGGAIQQYGQSLMGSGGAMLGSGLGGMSFGGGGGSGGGNAFAPSAGATNWMNTQGSGYR